MNRLIPAYSEITVKVGLALPTVDIHQGRAARLDELARRAEAAERIGFDSIWVMDHYFTERDGVRRGALDPMVTLAFLAARTSRLRLGSLVLCNSFRDAGQLAREAAALADAAGGRFILGLGAGWHQPEYDAFGIPFTHRVSRLEETLSVLPGLLAGERVDHDGRFLKLAAASIPVAAPTPPIWIAGGGERMLDLVARHAQGWNVAWHGEDPAPFGESVERLRAALDRAGRPRSEVEVSAGVLICPDPDLDSRGGRVVTGGAARIAERLRAYAAVGADTVIATLSIAPFTELDAAYPERMREVLAELSDPLVDSG